jgi:hypothetical protein
MGKPSWQAFGPVFPKGKSAHALLCKLTRQLAKLSTSFNHQQRNQAVEDWRRVALGKRIKCKSNERQRFGAAIHLLADLAKQGWGIRATSSRVRIARPDLANGAADDSSIRDQIRTQQLAERDAQLRERATVEFIREMESKKLFQGAFFSIFSLMRDGRDLAKKLLHAGTFQSDEEAAQVAADIVQPYLQFVDEEAFCSHTGFRLIDLWRYFRHTWTSAYKSIPGRTMMVLIRDAAAPCHPVVGIAALSSATVAISARDAWIGWTVGQCLTEIRERPSVGLANWLHRIVDDAIDEIYKVDLFEDEVLRAQDLRRPDHEVVGRLIDEARRQRKQHHDSMESKQYKKTKRPQEYSEEDWIAEARMPLFRSKRALDLAQMLRVRMTLARFSDKIPTKAGLLKLAGCREGREAIARIVRKAKAERVGNAMADLTVCGAMPPYNEILGGKLVALLMTSPEVVAAYRRRYGQVPSIIASSMAGRAVVRPAQLVLIGTTSLYGQRPCQYDRIRFPWALAGANVGQTFGSAEKFGRQECLPHGTDCIRYEYLGRTLGVGTSQFSKKTVEALTRLLQHSARGQQVNNVFGEGVNPRLRKLREGLEELGLDADELLRHGRPRIVYGAALAHNMRAYLLGRETRPKYIVADKDAKRVTECMCRWWVERWVVGRLRRDDVFERMAQHTPVHPIRHGARVVLPRLDPEQPLLFDEWTE